MLTKRLIRLGLLALAVCAMPLLATDPWYQTFTPVRTFYVSPTGTGSGTQSDPMSLMAAVTNPQPGDLYWLVPGSYTLRTIINASGTIDNPIVFRAQVGTHVTVTGRFQLNGGYIWIWGLEITDPNDIGPRDSGISMLAAGDRAINCVIHDIDGDVGNGIGAWDDGPGQVIYGNIIFHNGNGWVVGLPGPPHGIYTQNTYSENGYKYFVNNYIADPLQDCPPGCFNIQAYGSSGQAQGMYLTQDVFANGDVLLGGSAGPSDNEVVLANYFYNGSLNLGYHQVSQSTVQNNYMIMSQINGLYVWGAGGTGYVEDAPTVWTDNTVFAMGVGNQIVFQTAVNGPNGYCEDGCAPVLPDTVIDNNTYDSPFEATLQANGAPNPSYLAFGAWQSNTAQLGDEFDTHSAVVALPTTNQIVILPNEYEPGRAQLAIYNWSGATTVAVDLSSLLASGASFQITPIENSFGTPVGSGNYSGPVNVPMSSLFAAFLVTYSTSEPVISGVVATSSGTTTETIDWSTDIPSDSQVLYGTTAAYGQSSGLDSSLVTTHAVGLSGLSDGTLYHYAVQSRDASGNLTTSADFTFTAGADPLIISNVVSFGGNRWEGIEWATNEASTSQVLYGLTPSYGMMTFFNWNLLTDHTAFLWFLTPGTTYHYSVVSLDGSGNVTTSPDSTFQTQTFP